jgi:uncharacterized protein
VSFIADPWFYAAAIPAVLMMGLSKSGFLIGFGALATPLMALAVPVPQAAAIMLPLLLVMDFTSIQQLWRQRDRELLRLLLPAGLIGTVIGTLLFGVFSSKAVAAVVGALTLLFLAQRLVFPSRPDAPPPPKAVGFVLGIAAGFTSFVAHAGSPPLSAYVLPLRLEPLRFTATMAVQFVEVDSVCVARPARHAQPGHVAGAGAAGAAGRVARYLADAAHRLDVVLSHRLHRHGGDRAQVVVGRLALRLSRRWPRRRPPSRRVLPGCLSSAAHRP